MKLKQTVIHYLVKYNGLFYLQNYRVIGFNEIKKSMHQHTVVKSYYLNFKTRSSNDSSS